MHASEGGRFFPLFSTVVSPPLAFEGTPLPHCRRRRRLQDWVAEKTRKAIICIWCWVGEVAFLGERGCLLCATTTTSTVEHGYIFASLGILASDGFKHQNLMEGFYFLAMLKFYWWYLHQNLLELRWGKYPYSTVLPIRLATCLHTPWRIEKADFLRKEGFCTQYYSSR